MKHIGNGQVLTPADRRATVTPSALRGSCMPVKKGHVFGPSKLRGRQLRPPADRFWEKVDRRGPDECWPFIGCVCNTNGYGQIAWPQGTRRQLAHRVSWELAGNPPIPAGMTLDHDCHTRDAACPGGLRCLHRRCVNPSHLRVVSFAENVRLGRSAQATRDRAAERTHCKNGHEYPPDVPQRLDHPGRVCRQCACDRQRRYRARRRA